MHQIVAGPHNIRDLRDMLTPPSLDAYFTYLHPKMSSNNDVGPSPNRSRRRIPISCEPCRVRKIRCPRDAPPCSTCVRRRIPVEQCVYSSDRQSRSHQQSGPSPSKRPRLQNDTSAGDDSQVFETQPDRPALNETNASLVSRIEHLKRLLHAQGQRSNTTPSRPRVSEPAHSLEDSQTQTPTPFATGTLIPSTSGHVRFLPFSSSWRLVHRASHGVPFPDRESAVTDTPSGPFPFGEHEAENRPNLLAKLPPIEYCDQLKNLYFQSLAPVSSLYL